MREMRSGVDVADLVSDLDLQKGGRSGRWLRGRWTFRLRVRSQLDGLIVEQEREREQDGVEAGFGEVKLLT